VKTGNQLGNYVSWASKAKIMGAICRRGVKSETQVGNLVVRGARWKCVNMQIGVLCDDIWKGSCHMTHVQDGNRSAGTETLIPSENRFRHMGAGWPRPAALKSRRAEGGKAYDAHHEKHLCGRL
jgi:hypothetical protein